MLSFKNYLEERNAFQKVSRKVNKAISWEKDQKPQDILKRVSKMSDLELKRMRGDGWDTKDGSDPNASGSPRNLQIKAIERELKRRKLI